MLIKPTVRKEIILQNVFPGVELTSAHAGSDSGIVTPHCLQPGQERLIPKKKKKTSQT